MRVVSVFVVVCVGALVAGDEGRGEPRVVRTSQGAVRGYKEPGHKHYAFYGIPYATAPTGLHKFKAPLPPPTWTDTFEATIKTVICPQHNMLNQILVKNFNGIVTESCLIANVYVPDTKETKLPVVVYVHGGAFQMGFGDMISHTTLTDTGKVIVVNFNYRLGAHGFLCLGTEYAPGNAGMKDQVAALRWVKKNIAAFGGDPDDVTIAGYSAGSAAVELLMLSDLTRGLFNKVIPESGTATSVWAVQLDPLDNAKKFAASQNFTNVDDISALEHFYKTTSLDILLSESFLNTPDSTFFFVPCVESVTSEESFLKDHPVNIFKQGKFNKVPLLIGFSNMEGMFRLPLLKAWTDKMNEKFSEFLPGDLVFKNDEERETIANEIKQFYFGDKPVGVDTVQAYIDYFTDTMFAYSTLKSVKYNVAIGGESIYLYQYSYVDESQPTPFNIKGANHCAQSAAIGEARFMDTSKQSDDFKKIRQIMVDLWINFITKGTPVPAKTAQFPSGWPAVSRHNSAYMELNLSPELRSGLLEKRAQFWNRIYSLYYRTPVPPPQATRHHIKNEL